MGACRIVEQERRQRLLMDRARAVAKKRQRAVWEQMNTVVRLTVRHAAPEAIQAALDTLAQLTKGKNSHD